MPRKPTKKRTPKRIDREPEVLDENSVAEPTRQRVLDTLADWLQEQGKAMPVREAIPAVYGGMFRPDRELEVLQRAKKDGRFIISVDAKTNFIGLVGQEEPKAKTIGEHVADAKGRQQKISWPHDVGSHVLFLTDGQPPQKAVIRNIYDKGSFAHYDLNLGDGSTVNDLEAWRIGRDLDAEGELEQMRTRIGALERHAKRGSDLAQKYVEMAAVERTMAEALSKHRKSMEEVSNQLAEHARSEPGQTDIRDIVGDGENKPKRGEKMKAKPSAKEDKLADGKAPEATPMTDIDLSLEEIEAAAYNRATASTGKPQKVVPAYILDVPFICTDVQSGVATLLPLFTKKEWAKAYEAEFGAPRANESEKPTEVQATGGPLCGVPVKVRRATLFVGPLRDAALVRLPEKAEPAKAVGKDAAAGG